MAPTLVSVEVFVVAAARSPIAQRGGWLRSWHPADLLGQVLRQVAMQPGLDVEQIDDVIGACTTTVGEQGSNVARSAVLAAGWPETLPAFTIEGGRVAGMQALRNGLALVASGAAQTVVVAGVESSSRVPAGASTGVAVGKPFGPGVHERYAGQGGLVSPPAAVERLAKRMGIGRAEMDEWTTISRSRRSAAVASDAFKPFIVPVPKAPAKSADSDAWVVADEPPVNVTPEELQPMFEIDGQLTAANMAQPGDCAAAVVLMSKQEAERSGAVVLARLDAVEVAGSPVLEAATGAEAAQLCGEAASYDVVAVDEDTAVTPLAFAAAHGIDVSGLCPNGGALGAAGTGGASALEAVISVLPAIDGGRALVVCAGATPVSGAAVLSGWSLSTPVDKGGENDRRVITPASLQLGGEHEPERDQPQAGQQVPSWFAGHRPDQWAVR